MDTSLPYEEKRPWGEFITFLQNEQKTPLTIKILKVEPNQAFSLQRHQKRSEQWFIVSGQGIITIGEESEPLEIGKTYFIPHDTLHRLEAQAETIVALEISFGEFEEDDIIRVEDRYGRK